MFYGYREGMEPDLEDEDLQLIPHLVDMVVVPKLTGVLPYHTGILLMSVHSISRPAARCVGPSFCHADEQSRLAHSEVG